MSYHLCYRLLDGSCTLNDLATVMDRANACARRTEGHDKKKTEIAHQISDEADNILILPQAEGKLYFMVMSCSWSWSSLGRVS